MLEIFILCLLTGVAAGVIGGSKGRSGFGYFLLGFFLNIIGVLIAIGVPSLKPVNVASPSAASPSGKDLVICWSCGKPRVAGSSSWRPSCSHCGAGQLGAQVDQKKCPACAELIKAEALKCRYCGEVIAPAAPSPPPTRYEAKANWAKVDEVERGLDQHYRR